jgi:hypothetical protein
LFVVTGSVVVDVMVAVLVIEVSVVVGSTVAVNDALTTVEVVGATAFATVGMVHVHVFPATVAVPVVGVAGGVTGVKPVGSASVTTTPVASAVVLGLVTVTVYVTVSPGAAVVGSTVIATPRSTEAAPTTNVSVTVLFADVASSDVAVVEAVLAIELPTAAAAEMVAGTVTVTVVPLGMVAQLQAIVVDVGAGAHVEMPGGTEATVTFPNVTFAGAVSLSVTLVAALGPVLLTVIV